MDAERWRRLDELFQQALDLPPGQWAAFLDERCADDPALRHEVEAMLAADAADGGAGHDSVDPGATTRADDRLAGIVRSGAEEVAAETLARDPADTDGPAPWRRDAGARGLPFETLGPYRLIEELGRGGLATVYLAERDDEQFSMRVAVKLIRRGLDAPDLLERLRLERQILARLEHPNIARLIDGGTAPDGRPYFVMERIEGVRIDHWCDQQELDLRSRLELFRQLCDAVQTAHRRLVLHRDIKPSNILVTREGVPKLLDFGIAKLLDAPGDDGISTLAQGFSTLTDTGMRLLTPEFASPEQVRGETLTTASDVYSLGVLLYLLVTGESPYTFDRRRPAEVERVVCETRPPRPSSVVWARRRSRLDVPTRWSLGWPRRAAGDDVDTIVRKALRKEPERRYVSVARLADDLRCYLEDLPISARPDTLRYRTGKFIRRHRGLVAAALALVLVLMAGVVATSWQARVARRAQQQAERQKDLAEEQRRQAELQQRRAEEATAFLVDLFEVSDPFETLGAKVTARELLDRGAERLRSELGDDPLLRATLLATIGRVYKNLSLLEESDELLGEALEIRIRVAGDDSGEALDSLWSLANLRIDQERLREAEEGLEQVVAMLRSRGGREEDSTFLACVLDDLAMVKGRLDQPTDAEALLEEALALHLARGDELAAAQTRTTLAQQKRRRGEVEVARSLLDEVLAVRRRHLGEDHPLVALTLNDLANTFQETGDFGAAEGLYREVLGSYRKTFGERHHHVASAMLNLADSLVLQRKLGEGFALYDRHETLVADLYGADHPAMARALHSRGLAHRVAGHPEEAIPLVRRAWAINSVHFGVDHSSALRNASQLAELMVATHDPQAERFLLELIEALRLSMEPSDPRLSHPLLNLGMLRLAEGSPGAAEAPLEEALELRRRGLPTGHWATAQAEGQLGRCLVRLGRLDAAEALLRSSYETLQRQYPQDHPQTVAVRGYLDELERTRAAS